jgi:hypothetical protein
MQLGTREGFFKAYWSALPDQPTQTESFNAINEEHFEHFGEYKYNDYNSFRKQLHHDLKTRRK